MDAQAKRRALRKLSNGVYVLTSRSGAHFGAATVTWVSQASFKPPLLMAAVRRDSNVFQCLSESGTAVLHVLANGQEEVARRFFAPTAAAAGAINGVPFSDGTTAAPILIGLPAHVECGVDRIVDTEGDHAIVILRVVEAECCGDFKPLTIADSPWEYGG